MPPLSAASRKGYNICCICLSTEKSLVKLKNDLDWFYEDFCDYSNHKNSSTCTDCLDVLNKCFLFKKQCKIANKLFAKWEKDGPKTKQPLSSLNQLLLSYNIDSDCNSDSDTNPEGEGTEDEEESTNNSKKTDNKQNNSNKGQRSSKDVLQNYFLNRNNNSDHRQIIDDANVSSTTDPRNEANYENALNEGEWIDEDSDGHIGDNDNNDMLVDKEANNGINNDLIDMNDVIFGQECEVENLEKEDGDIDTEQIIEYFEGSNKRIHKRTISKKKWDDYKQYESVFQITLFKNLSEILAEFAQRQSSERYLSAKYRCELCYMVYSGEKNLRFHLRWHEPSAGDHVCDICGMRFRSRKRLLCHKRQVHCGRFACKMCPLVTYHTDVMICHFNMHSGAQYKCQVCDKTFRHVSSWKTHRRVHATRHACPVCALSFVSDMGLNMHMRLRHREAVPLDPELAARCEECDLAFVSQEVLHKHYASTPDHKQVEFKVCKQCGDRFEKRSLLLAHKKEKHKPEEQPTEREVTCNLCGQSFRTRMLWRHYAREHVGAKYQRVASSRDKSRSLCDQCGRVFTCAKELSEHANTHLGLRPFACPACPKHFATSVSLRRHVPTHSPPTIQCSFCSKMFNTARNLHKHIMMSHNSDRRYKCVHCGKGFLDAKYLKQHVRGVHLHERPFRRSRCMRSLKEHVYSHSGLRPHACGSCPARFQTRSALRRHGERHRPPARACTVCGLKFVTAANLDSHMKHHGIKKYKCPICGKGIVHLSGLHVHMRGVHGNRASACLRVRRVKRGPRARRNNTSCVEKEQGSNEESVK